MTPPEAAPHRRPTVLLLLQRVTLPWIFEAAERAGIDLVLVPRPDESVDQQSLPPSVTRLLHLDVANDPEAALSALKEVHTAAPFQGVITLYDPAVPFAARAAEALGLPGLPVDSARAAQDKRLMRARFAAAGLNTPGFRSLTRPEDWHEAADLRFPLVVKPATGVNSLGVTRAGNDNELKDVTQQVHDLARQELGKADGLVVEEYLDGPEYAVESLAHRGEVRVLSIGYKGRPQGPHFEEGVYQAPAALSEQARQAVVREVTGAHRALGITDGPTHAELRLGPNGDPYLLEIGARVGGSGVSHYIVEAVSGIDFAAEALRCAIGAVPRSWKAGPHDKRGAAGNYIVPCGGQGKITRIEGLHELSHDERVDHVVQMLHPGDVVRPYPDFSGFPAFVLSRHGGLAEVEAFHGQLAESIRIDYVPEDSHEAEGEGP